MTKERPELLIVAINGDIAALDRLTGQEKWRTGLASSGWGAVALAFDGEVVLASALGAVLFCLDYETGEVLWTRPTQKAGGRATILVDDGLIFVSRGGEVECFNRAGNRLWHQKLKGMGTGSAALGMPHIVTQADG